MKGLEPSTFCMASRRSSQLSYIRGEAAIIEPPGGGLASLDSALSRRPTQLGRSCSASQPPRSLPPAGAAAPCGGGSGPQMKPVKHPPASHPGDVLRSPAVRDAARSPGREDAEAKPPETVVIGTARSP